MSTSTTAAVPSKSQADNATHHKELCGLINCSEETLTNGRPSMDDQLDAKMENAIKALRQTRSAMDEMPYPLSTSELSDLVCQARKITRKMSFVVRRHFDAREEGIRFRCEREVLALGKQEGLVKYFTKQVSTACEKSRLTANTSQRDKRLQLLEDAMAKVDMHRMLALLAEGNGVQY
ncbi:hypothetical protein BKA56DRAFT_615880 [Ilyonectria sp. MPI-CAGE-AT-0026]|nr:hypothetical protein BKA56DRAFT_615880 [Ilyonectria sp. MPI-CAGE-AT-0026]